MPYKDNSELPSSVKDNLPDSAQTMYRDVFNSAWEGTCKDSSNKDECAAKVAWGTVHKNFHKDAEGKWVSNKSLITDFSLTITKATYDKVTGERRWAGTLSDTAKDTYGEKMSLQLFQDFINHITNGDPIPDPFQTDYYKGGMPYVSLAHYPDLNGKAVLGDTTDLYIDGKQLKAKGTFNDTPLGRAAFNSVCKSLYDNTEKDKQPVRLSIGFLDMGHAHGDQEFVRNSITDVCPMCLKGFGDKEYRSGYLIHEALTRVPVNPRTEIVAEVNKSMADEIKTRLDDATSIVGEELAEEVEKEASTMVGKSDVMVIKAEDVHCEDCGVPVEKADNSAQDDQKARSEKYGIAVLPQGHLTKPGQWKDVPDSEWGDPVNYRYPMPDKAHAANAASRFGQEGESYKGKDTVGSRIKAREKALGVEAVKTEEKKSKVVEKTISLDANGAIVGDVLHPSGMPNAQADSPKDMADKVKEQQETMIPAWATDILNMLRQLMGQKAPESGVYAKDSTVEEIMAIHPLQTYIDELTSVYTKCCSSKEMDKTQKLQSIQEAFSKLGEGIKKGIAELPDYPQPEISTEMKSSVMIAEAVSKAVATQLQPLVDQVSLITQQMGTERGTRSVVASIPQRRSIDPTLVQQSQSQAPGPKSVTPKLHDLIQKTLGPGN